MINCEIVWHPQVEFYQGPRSHSRMPSLVGDSGQVLGVLGFNWKTGIGGVYQSALKLWTLHA